MLDSFKRVLLGKKLDPLDPSTRGHVVLIAFLAWIGLGADGLSSACYGPEEAFLALGPHKQLGLFLALATAGTVFIIALAYNQVIELFPSGGGGYKAATKLIGARAGLISGSALIIDYVLTISISVASGAEALYSLLPPSWQTFKFSTELVLIILLIVLNLRGMKESIRFLLPIFLGFFISHVALIVYGVQSHASDVGMLLPNSVEHARTLADEAGWVFVLALFLRAYSLGAGTYTGIEAVSNAVNTLAEPRVRTGHWTMFYMAASLAFTAGGIILLYLVWDAQPVHGQTLNAVVFRDVIGSIGLGSARIEHLLLIIVLALEAGLLMVAANTGFLGGPAVLANMAADRWVPRQFRQLSSRMVTQNGVLVMGVCALVVLALTHGKVSLLVVLYSINVFMTFSLSLFGLCRHWLDERRLGRRWRGSFTLSAIGFGTVVFILLVTIYEKFLHGGWVTLLLTGAVAVVCIAVRRHYDETQTAMRRVDERYSLKMDWDDQQPSPPLDPAEPTAVFLIGANRGAGMHMLQWVLNNFPGKFRNYLFISVGEVDKQAFDGESALKSLQARIDNSLRYYTSYCVSRGLAAASFQDYGADPLEELEILTLNVLKDYPNSVCFASKLIFKKDSLLTRLLHNQLPTSIQRRLNLAGFQTIIVPIQVPEPPSPQARPLIG